MTPKNILALLDNSLPFIPSKATTDFFLSPEISLHFLKFYIHVYSFLSGFFHSAFLFWDSSFCDIYQKFHPFLPLYECIRLSIHMTFGLFLVFVHFKGRYHDHLSTVLVWKYTFVSLTYFVGVGMAGSFGRCRFKFKILWKCFPESSSLSLSLPILDKVSLFTFSHF